MSQVASQLARHQPKPVLSNGHARLAVKTLRADQRQAIAAAAED